jgi:hypothetical protein
MIRCTAEGFESCPELMGRFRPCSVTIPLIERKVLAFCLFQPSCFPDIATHRGGITPYSGSSPILMSSVLTATYLPSWSVLISKI